LALLVPLPVQFVEIARGQFSPRGQLPSEGNAVEGSAVEWNAVEGDAVEGSVVEGNAVEENAVDHAVEGISS
jgi:hypothetical protein